MLPKLPDAHQVYNDLYEAITHNKRPTLLLHAFLVSGAREANLIGNTLLDYRDAILLLTSPAGRKWLHHWLDDTLNFLRRYAEQATR